MPSRARSKRHVPRGKLDPAESGPAGSPRRADPERISRRRTDPGRVAKRAARRLELLDAADRVVRRDGPAASMDHIAAEAGVAKPILYRHFGDKGELYRALVDRYVQELIGELRGAWSETSPRAQLSGAIDTYLAFIDREREAYRFLMHRAVGEPEARVAVSQFIAQVATEVAVLLGDDLRRFGVDSGAAEPWAHGIVGLVQLSGEWWLDHPTMSRAALVDYLVTLLWSGFSGLEAGASNVRG